MVRAAKRAPCARCGLVHERCSGHADIYDNGDYKTGTKIGERPCRHWPMHGQRICQTHGGKGRNKTAGREAWKKAQTKDREMERLERAVKTFGLPVTISPQQALLDEIARTAGHVLWLGEQIANLAPEEVGWGLGSEEKREGVGEMETQIDLTTTTKVARPSVLIELYHKERSHLVHVAKVAIQCGIAERQIKLAEEQGQMIAQVLRQVFEDPELELTLTQVQVARTVASRVLRGISVSAGSRAPLSVVRSLADGEEA
jgi:hypothetical protein